MSGRNPIPKEPSPLALAIRAVRERAILQPLAEKLAHSTALLRVIALDGNPPGLTILDQCARNDEALADFMSIASEVREIERQMG